MNADFWKIYLPLIFTDNTDQENFLPRMNTDFTDQMHCLEKSVLTIRTSVFICGEVFVLANCQLPSSRWP
jgi:hypothetical protein